MIEILRPIKTKETKLENNYYNILNKNYDY